MCFEERMCSLRVAADCGVPLQTLMKLRNDSTSWGWLRMHICWIALYQVLRASSAKDDLLMWSDDVSSRLGISSKALASEKLCAAFLHAAPNSCKHHAHAQQSGRLMHSIQGSSVGDFQASWLLFLDIDV